MNDTFDESTSARQVCVVIPAFNEELLIGRCIQSVLTAGVPAADIYVIDDHSSDRTAERVRSFPGVNLLQNGTNVGKLHGLRTALLRFDLLRRYRYLSLLDADSCVSENYIASVVDCFDANPGIVLVCGGPESERYNWLTAYRALEYAMTLKVYRRGQDRLGVITVAPGCASTYRTSIMSDLRWDGGTLVEDMDLTMQIHRKRLGRIAYAADAVTYTQDPRTLREYFGQLTRWYSGTWQVMRLHRLPFGGQRIDAEFALLTAEGLGYGLLACALPLVAWCYPAVFLKVLVLDQLLWFGLACFTAVQLKRADVLLYFPTFLLLRLVNCVVLLRTFWREVIRARRLERWFSVSRYAGSPVPQR